MPKKQLHGKVTSIAAQSTVKVEVKRQWRDPLYKKSVKRSKSYSCHYSGNDLALGDEVVIEECRPVSKTKRFRVISKIEK